MGYLCLWSGIKIGTIDSAQYYSLNLPPSPQFSKESSTKVTLYLKMLKNHLKLFIITHVQWS